MIPADDPTPPVRDAGPSLRWQVRGDDGACDQDAMRFEVVDGNGPEADARAVALAMRGRFSAPGSRVEVRAEHACGHLHTVVIWALQHDGEWTALMSPLDVGSGVVLRFVVPLPAPFAMDDLPAITSKGGRA